jgi:hypothetical protein
VVDKTTLIRAPVTTPASRPWYETLFRKESGNNESIPLDEGNPHCATQRRRSLSRWAGRKSR